MRLTPNFTLEELEFSETATRLGINNKVPEQLMDNIMILAKGLQDVRKLLGTPLYISSGYRCIELNNILKSKPTSAHVKGLAADFRPSGDHNIDSAVAAIVDSDICYDQIINEYNQWVHISFAESGRTPRKQALSIDNSGVKIYNK